MTVRIRLKRIGRKKKPVYRVVVANQTSQRDGRVIEEIGLYDPLQEPTLFNFKKERLDYWIGVGAECSDPVVKLLGEAGEIPKKIHKQGKYFGITKKDRKVEKIEE